MRSGARWAQMPTPSHTDGSMRSRASPARAAPAGRCAPPGTHARRTRVSSSGIGSTAYAGASQVRPRRCRSTSAEKTVSAEVEHAQRAVGVATGAAAADLLHERAQPAATGGGQRPRREVEREVGDGGQAEHARPALPRGLPGEVAHEPSRLLEAAGRGGQRADEPGADRQALGAQGVDVEPEVAARCSTAPRSRRTRRAGPRCGASPSGEVHAAATRSPIVTSDPTSMTTRCVTLTTVTQRRGSVGVRAVQRDEADAAHRLGVLHQHGRVPVRPGPGGIAHEARQRGSALEGADDAGGLAGQVAVRGEEHAHRRVAEPGGGTLGEGRAHGPRGGVGARVQPHDAVGRADGLHRAHETVEHEVRPGLQQDRVLRAARLALRTVDHDPPRTTGGEHRAPLGGDREVASAATGEADLLERVDELGGAAQVRRARAVRLLVREQVVPRHAGERLGARAGGRPRCRRAAPRPPRRPRAAPGSRRSSGSPTGRPDGRCRRGAARPCRRPRARRPGRGPSASCSG